MDAHCLQALSTQATSDHVEKTLNTVYFQGKFSIFTHVIKPVRDTNCEPGLPVVKEEKRSKISLGSKVRLLKIVRSLWIQDSR